MSVHPGLCWSNSALSTGLRLEHEPLVFDCSPENGPLTRREAVVKLSAVEFDGGLFALCRPFWHPLALARWAGEQHPRGDLVTKSCRGARETILDASVTCPTSQSATAKISNTIQTRCVRCRGSCVSTSVSGCQEVWEMSMLLLVARSCTLPDGFALPFHWSQNMP